MIKTLKSNRPTYFLIAIAVWCLGQGGLSWI